MDQQAERRIRAEAHEFAERLATRLCEALKQPAPGDPYKRVFGIDAQPAPALEVRERLEKAGATVRGGSWVPCQPGMFAVITTNGTIEVNIHGLTPDRAEAALRAAREDDECHLYVMNAKLTGQLSALNAEVERLKGILADIAKGTKDCLARNRPA